MMPPMPQMRRMGGFGPQMMGPGRMPYAGQGFSGMPRGPVMGGPMNMGPRQMQQPMQRPQGRGGGLLARLFGKSGSGQAMATRGTGGPRTAAGQAGAGSILKSIGNPETINNFLANTQNVINTAQSFGPLIEQYGPLVRNIPAMWKLYRGLKNSDDGKSTSKAPEENSKKTEVAPVMEKAKINPSKKAESSRSVPRRQQEGEKNRKGSSGDSRPKLFF